MKMSKALLFVVVMSVLSLLMLAQVALAAAPTVTMPGVPANIPDGTSFKVTVTGASTGVPAGQTINSLSLVSSNANFSVSPAVITCTAASAICVEDFNVNVAAGSPVGSSATLTATAIASNGEVGSTTAVSTVSGTAASNGNKVPVKIDSAQIDGFDLSTSGTTTRDMERGSTFSLKLQLTGVLDTKDVEARAFVSGADSGSQSITDSVGPFDVQKGVSYVKTLTLKLPDRVTEDAYRIRVVVAGRDNDALTQDFRIQVTPTAHSVIIKDLNLDPADNVQPGRAVLATVRLKNLGDKSEKDIKVAVSIPELGVSATPDYVDVLKTDESATSQEFFLRIEPCAKPGTYDVKAEVTFNQGDKTVTALKQITVSKGGQCSATAAQPSVVGGVKIAYSPDAQDVQVGGSAVSYPVTIMNDGSTAKTYSIAVSGADWAMVKLTPSNMVTVKPGESQTVYVFVSAKGSASGAQAFVVRIKDQAGDVVKELPMSANVVGSSTANVAGLVQLMQLGLIALIVVLVIVGVVVAFRRMKGPREGEEGTQTYY